MTACLPIRWTLGYIEAHRLAGRHTVNRSHMASDICAVANGILRLNVDGQAEGALHANPAHA